MEKKEKFNLENKMNMEKFGERIFFWARCMFRIRINGEHILWMEMEKLDLKV